MANQAFLDAVNGTMSKEGLWGQMRDSMGLESYFRAQAAGAGPGTISMPDPGSNYTSAASQEHARQMRLQQLISLGGSGGGTSNSPAAMDPTALANTTKSAAAQMGVTGPGQSSYDTALQKMMTGAFDSADPSYKWRFDQGQQAVERSAAAKGLLGSGNVLQELMSYGQGMASTEYAAQFDRLMKGSQNATSQYDAAIKGLSAMAGIQYNQGMLGVAQENAATNRFSAQANAANQAGHLGLDQAKFGYQQTQDSEAERAHKDYLATLANPMGQVTSNPSPNAPVNSVSYYSRPAPASTVSNSGYVAPSTGWWSSSSGGGGSWGDAGASGFGTQDGS